MAESLFSSSWYRVADLTPRLRSHAKIHRHRYRNQTWYILQDHSTERFHRFSPPAYHVIGLMDGTRTVQELWDLAVNQLEDDAPTQDQLIQLLGQLHAADVLQCDVPPDTDELFRRGQRQRRKLWQSRLFSVFSWRFPLFDPERVLQALLPVCRPFLGWTGAILWLLVVGPAMVLAGVHWAELTENVLDQVMTPHNMLLLWLLFPVLKLLHELGHGLAVKKFGGEVHEIGIMILVLTPVPYVDASSSWSFREKWRRIFVSAAGMVVEVFLAAIALYIWLSVEPGLIRTLAYNTMLIAGVSTILFNANPLLRFDGYYIFSDLLEIPNLRSRSNSYLGYVCERYLFGRKEASLPQATRGEKSWFVTYGISAFFYRIFIMTAIVLFILDEYFLLGVILGIFGAIMWVIVPVGKGLVFLFTNARLRTVRGRAIVVTGLLICLLVGSVGFIPVPWRTVAEGVVWLPDEAYVRAEVNGFVDRVMVESGTRVRKGEILFLCVNPELSTEMSVLTARLKELEARFRQQLPEDRVKAAIVKEEMQYVRKELAQTQERFSQLTVRSQIDGTFVAPNAVDLPHRFVRRGEQLAVVVDLNTITVRSVVTQSDIDIVQDRTIRVDARLAERLNEVTPASVTRIVPTATDELPSRALGSEGGGELIANPVEGEGSKVIEKVFLIDLELPIQEGLVNAGGRVYVRFDHGLEPLAGRWARSIRQLFLSRFNV